MNDLSTGMTFAELDTDAVASISSSAMLVDLTVTQTRMRKNDPEARCSSGCYVGRRQ